jgi:hypothetical protein
MCSSVLLSRAEPRERARVLRADAGLAELQLTVAIVVVAPVAEPLVDRFGVGLAGTLGVGMSILAPARLAAAWPPLGGR